MLTTRPTTITHYTNPTKLATLPSPTHQPNPGDLYMPTGTYRSPKQETLSFLVVNYCRDKGIILAVPVLAHTHHSPTVHDIILDPEHTTLSHSVCVLTNLTFTLPERALGETTLWGKITNNNIVLLVEESKNMSERELYQESEKIGASTGPFIPGEKGHLAQQRRQLVTALHHYGVG